ncbi:hypothetical protein JCM19274_431 [Algibacter lectus]|uniref:Uncharacterized protein n=1 Tax=Algibacter lectus TaxID=221126 RepID=A0A090WX92_9FLAO|nr:hypothetical protein JCM19274_431 [Algibacter lectus]
MRGFLHALRHLKPNKPIGLASWSCPTFGYFMKIIFGRN